MIFFALAGFCFPGISKITVFFSVLHVFCLRFRMVFGDNLIALISFGFLWIRGLFLTRFLYFYWFLVNLFGNGFLWDSLDVFAFLKLFKHFLYVFFLHVALFFYMLFYFFYMLFFSFTCFHTASERKSERPSFFLHVQPEGMGHPQKYMYQHPWGQKKILYVFVPAPRKLSELAQQESVKQIYMFAYRLRGHAAGAGCKNTCFHTTSVGMGLRRPKHIKKPSR